MRDNRTTKWASGLKFVQWSKNNRHHSGIKSTPYSALFSHEPQLGLSTSTIPKELIDRIETEEDLEALINEEEEETHGPPVDVVPHDSNDNNDDPSHLSSGITNQQGVSFDLGVHIPISDVGSEVAGIDQSENSDYADESDENKDPHENVLSIDPNDSNIFNILEKSGIYSEFVCPFCNDNFVGKSMCARCSTYCHEKPACSVWENGIQFCIICARKNAASAKRKGCKENLQKQSVKMIEASNKRFKPAQIGDNVLVPIPDVDKGRTDFRNICGVVTKVNGDGCYTIGTEQGILKQAYTRNQFMPTKSAFMSTDQVREKLVSLREAARGASVGGGQGYERCNCKTGCSIRCSCRKNGRLCNSKCHQSLSCSNK